MIENMDGDLKELKISKNQTIFQQCQSFCEVLTIGDYNVDNLSEISRGNPSLFNQLLRVLALYNITFKGFHSRLNIIVDVMDTFNFADNVYLNDVLQNDQIKRILNNLGFKNKESLNGVNQSKLINYLNRYIPIEIVEREFANIYLSELKPNLVKNIKLQDQYLTFSQDQLEFEINIDDSSMKIINQYFIDDQVICIGDLPQDLDSYFSNKTGVGVGKKEKLFSLLQNFSGEEYHYEEVMIASKEIILKEFSEGEILINNSFYQIPGKYLEKKIDYDCFTPVIAEFFKNEGVTLFKHLKGDIVNELASVPKLGKRKIELFIQFLLDLIQNGSEDKTVARFRGIYKALCEIDELVNFDARDIEIFLSRYKYFKGGFNTLEFVSKEHNLTRERVRQIVKKIARKLANNFYWFWIDLRDYKDTRPFFTINQIEDFYKMTFSSEERRFIGAILAEIGDSWKYEEEEGCYHQATSEEIQMMEKIIQIEVENLFTSNLYVDYLKIENLLINIQENYPTVPVMYVWTKSEIKKMVIEGETNLFLKASLEDMAYKVFCIHFPKGLHLPKDADKLSNVLEQELPHIEFNYSDRNITVYIQRTACLWNRGYYVPKSRIENYKLNQFEEILGSIEQHLRENFLVEMSINLIFECYQEKLDLLNIDNHYALYTILKFLEPSSIYFRKLPYIRLTENAESEQVTQAEQIEDYFFNAGKPLDRAIAFEYFTKTVGMPTFSFEQRLGLNCNNIVQFDSNQYVHIDNIEVDEEKLDMLVKQLKNEVEKFDDPIPITIIKRALLKRAKINSYHLLFSLIKYHYSDTFTFYRYPQISNREVVKLGQVSLKNQLEQFLLEQDEIVFISQINNRFTSQGWTPKDISIRFSLSELILPIEKGAMYVHSDVLGLTELKIDNLAEQIHEYYLEHYESQGHFFISVNDDLLYLLQQAIEFPKLINNQVWTIDLLKAILKSSGRFFTPFIKDTVLFSRDNKYDLEDVESIVVYILKAIFEGKTTIKSLEKWLIENQVMTYKYFKRILEEEAQYIHDGILIWANQ